MYISPLDNYIGFSSMIDEGLGDCAHTAIARVEGSGRGADRALAG